MFQSNQAQDILKRELDLRVASANGNLDYVRNFVNTYKDSININSFSAEGKDEKQTALHLACENGHVEVAIVLIEQGANINAKGLGGDTPLHGAIKFGKVHVVRALLKQGADREMPNDYGDTPIDYAQAEGYEDIIDCFNDSAIVRPGMK
jgi:ankyrin repeat protein